jgi:hypothetical protein
MRGGFDKSYFISRTGHLTKRELKYAMAWQTVEKYLVVDKLQEKLEEKHGKERGYNFQIKVRNCSHDCTAAS